MSDFFKINIIWWWVKSVDTLHTFSKEKYEDEFIAKIRLNSLVWAT